MKKINEENKIVPKETINSETDSHLSVNELYKKYPY